MKNKLLKDLRKRLDEPDSFFDGEIDIFINVASNVLDKYIDTNKTKNSLVMNIKHFINGKIEWKNKVRRSNKLC